MADEIKPEKVEKTEPETNKDKVDKVENTSTIKIDLEGLEIEVPLDVGKKLIEKRQANKKEVADLKAQVASVEAKAKEAASKAALLEAVKAQDIESIKTQVASEYLEKIQKYENKIFDSEIKANLSSLGVIDSALDDALKLAKADIKIELKDGNVTLADKPAKDYLSEWIKNKQHLVAVKNTQVNPGLAGRGGKLTQANPGDMSKGIGKIFGM